MTEQTPQTVDLATCDAEPIHVPGRVQPHGVLLVLDENDFVVTQASANASDFFDCGGAPLAGRPLADFLLPDSFARLTAAAAHPDPRPLAPIPCAASGMMFDGILHRHANRLILELEPATATTDADPDRLVRFTLANLRNGLHLKPFCETLAREVRALTGYDRVMVYRFDPEWNGEVYTEDKRDDLEPFLGIHYPASDIPAQARRLYHLNLVRHIPTITYTSAPLVPELDPATGQPLDLSHAVLRSVSPIHVEYLQNMGVAGTLTISLLKDGRLWGLVACHHYAPKFLPYRVRAACESLGILVSLQLSAKEDAEELRNRVTAQGRLATRAAAGAGGEPAPELVSRHEDFVGVARAGGAAMVSGGRAVTAGRTPDRDAVLRLARWLAESGRGDYETNALPAAFPEADRAVASGLLALALGGGDYLMWFRPEVVASVHWAGDPYYKGVMVGPNGPRLTPRGSFSLWREEQRGKAEVWGNCDREAARTLRDMVLASLARRAAGLEAEARRRDDFLAAVAHELRNPLGPIQNAAALVRLSTGRPEVATKAADMIDRQAGHLRRLIEDLLDASRVGRGKLRVNLNRLDLRDVVKAAAEDRRRDADNAGLTLSVSLPADPVWVQGDTVRLAQVVTNLVGNALKFTDRGGRIDVSVSPDGASARLAVADTGIGIPAAALPTLFDPFVQAEEGLDRSREGLGLGLSLVKALAVLHGGDVRAESAGTGHGSTFVVRIPLAGPS